LEEKPGVTSVPTVLSRFAARLRSSANRFFGERFDLSLLEWRILSHIASVGPCSAYDIWTSQYLEKAAVSRAVRDLKERDLIDIVAVPNVARRTTKISLTAEGRRRYAATFDEVEKRHARLIGGLTAEQVETLIDMVNYLDARIPLMGSEAEPFDVDLMSIRQK
jgi:DNA-binding MarR family transcriptional regulator